ncbi:hypothetical protein Tco_1023709 [Tanacetum coccineum]
MLCLYSLVVCPAEEEEFFELKQEEEEVFIQEEIPQISLNALNGSNNLQIIRVTGKIGKHELHILIDCGSTHNFLDEDVANKIGTQPVNIRPYRHLPTQKDAIKAMIKELLDAGVIKPSNSRFASPIVIVKKG